MVLSRPMARAAVTFATLAGCASTLPRAEMDRCSLGAGDGNEAFQERQGAACRMVAQRLIADEKLVAAAGFARKACQLEDARGCDQYIALVRGQPALSPDEVVSARTVGDKACSGMVVDVEGGDALPGICARVAELYFDLEPRSSSDAARLWARACALGDDRSCAHAKSLGAGPDPRPAGTSATTPPAPPPRRADTPPATASPPAQCHQMRSCVGLEVRRLGAGEVAGTLTNHCGVSVSCTWCPARGDQIDKDACRTTTLGADESKGGRDAGLWYVGYTAIAYDCMDATDAPACGGM